jgi:hypothetical protein
MRPVDVLSSVDIWNATGRIRLNRLKAAAVELPVGVFLRRSTTERWVKGASGPTVPQVGGNTQLLLYRV